MPKGSANWTSEAKQHVQLICKYVTGQTDSQLFFSLIVTPKYAIAWGGVKEGSRPVIRYLKMKNHFLSLKS